jgi:hypothetical protein
MNTHLHLLEAFAEYYRASRSARARDRLRQRVLENLGWRIHRLWTVDWFRDPAGETSRIVRRIERLRATERDVSAPAVADVVSDREITPERRDRPDDVRPEERT